MAITYTWKITNLRKVEAVEGYSDVVVHARWARTGIDEDGNDGTFHGATPLKLPSNNVENFTPFDELTEEQIIEWIKSETTTMPGYEQHMVEQINKQIKLKKNPIIDVDVLPWGVQVSISPETTTPNSAATSSYID
jgi:hypothetical protein